MNSFLVFISLIFLLGASDVYSEDEVFSAPRAEYFLRNAKEPTRSTILHLEEYVHCLVSNKVNDFCSSDNKQRTADDIKYLLNLEVGMLKNYKTVFGEAMEKKDMDLNDSRKIMRSNSLDVLINTHVLANVYSERCGKKSDKDLFKDAGVDLYLKLSDESNVILVWKEKYAVSRMFNKKELEVIGEEKGNESCSQDLLTIMYILVNSNKFLLERISSDKDLALIQYMSAYIAAISIVQEKISQTSVSLITESK